MRRLAAAGLCVVLGVSACAREGTATAPPAATATDEGTVAHGPAAGAPPSTDDEGPAEADGAAPAVRSYRSPRGHEAVAQPTSVRIPVIGVDSGLQDLGRDGDGVIDEPSDWDRAGWWTGGPRPGQRGPAVILGHVDSRAGPAVFYRLDELRPGDEVAVDREDGSTALFVVDRLERHPKDEFPTDLVYFPTLEPTLRLVTCGGEYDSTTGRYRDNVVVFATLVG